MFDVFGAIIQGLQQKATHDALCRLHDERLINQKLMMERDRLQRVGLVMAAVLTSAQKNAPTGPRLSQQTLRMFPAK